MRRAYVRRRFTHGHVLLSPATQLPALGDVPPVPGYAMSSSGDVMAVRLALLAYTLASSARPDALIGDGGAPPRGPLEPWGDLDGQHQSNRLRWLKDTDDVFRRSKPATPAPHLVSYVVLVDPDNDGSSLLVDHISAEL